MDQKSLYCTKYKKNYIMGIQDILTKYKAIIII